MSKPLFWMHSWSSWTAVGHSWGGDKELSHLVPTAQVHHGYQATSKESLRILKRRHFQKACPLCKPALSLVYKSTQAEADPSQFGGPSFPLCYLLCSSISLIKAAWKFFWDFLSISILRNSRTTMLVTILNRNLKEWKGRTTVRKNILVKRKLLVQKL